MRDSGRRYSSRYCCTAYRYCTAHRCCYCYRELATKFGVLVTAKLTVLVTGISMESLEN